MLAFCAFSMLVNWDGLCKIRRKHMEEKSKDIPIPKKKFNLPQLAQFRDVRAIGLLIFLMVALAISWNGARAIQRNYELQKQISELQQENAVLDLQNNNIKLQNQYYNTEQYLDLKARQDFGLGQPGETLLLVPKETALAYAGKLNKPADTVPTPESRRPAYQRNFQAWMDFFLHRQRQIDAPAE
jgi:cell division protein FtsB